jgi:hypothetical protein
MLVAGFLLFFFATSQALQIPIGTARGQGTHSAPAGSQVARYEGRTENIHVPVVMEPWSATAVATVPPEKKIVRFVGRFPGFEASKRQANLHARTTVPMRAWAANAAAQDSGTPSGSSVVFEGPNESDTLYIPPNPNIAAGPNYLVVLINSLIAIYDKSGNLQGGFTDLPTFFASLGVSGDVYDPRVIYDQNDGRFIMSFTNVDLSNPTFGNVLLAVSQTSDPTGNWYKFMLDSKGFNAADNASTFPDFPTLGLSSSAVYISNGQFELNSVCLYYGGCNFSDTWIRVISLPALLSGNSNLTITAFTDVRTATDFPAFALESALTFGSSSDEFLVGAEFSANPGFTLNVFRVNTTGTPTLSTTNLTVPSFAIPPDAFAENGYIETGDFRPLNAVVSNGILWCAQNSADNAGQAAVGRWYAISVPSLAGLALSQTGTISGSGEAYFPAVAVKPNGDAFVSFTTSSMTEFASAAFTGRGASDAPGSMRGYSIYRMGTDGYTDFAFRWGDYNGAALDPDGNSVWTIVEYAGSPNPHFGTAIAQISQFPLIAPSTISLSFGNQSVTVTSLPQSVTISSVSGSSLTMGTASLAGADAADFAVSADTCSGATLPAAGTCTISITFTPSALGLRSATLAINSNPPAFPVMVFLSGNGVPLAGALVLSPSGLQFPNTPVRGSSPAQSVQFTNKASVPFPIAYIQADTPFAESNDCGASLAAGASCTISVTFRPPSANSFTGTLEVVGVAQNYSTSWVSISLSGAGITAPAAALCPTTVSFGNQNVGSASAPISVGLNNTGSSNLTVTQITISGDFGQTSTCVGAGANLPALTACTINVTFTPTATGVRNGTLTVADNAAGSPHQVSLTGTGVASSATLLPMMAPSAHPPVGPALRTLGLGKGEPDARAKEAWKKAYAELPLTFEANRGQFNPRVKFLSRGPGYSLFLTAREAVLALRKPSFVSPPSSVASGQLPGIMRTEHQPADTTSRTTESVLRMKLVGANTSATVAGADELPGMSNYFLGNDPHKWRTHVPNYARVRYLGIYPGIDLVYYGRERQLEYDFVLAPGADPGQIRFQFSGSEGKPGLAPPRIDANGDVLVSTGESEIRLRRPIAYQLAADAGPSPTNRQSQTQNRQVLESRYELTARNEVRFALGPYDRSRPLIIDPTLTYSTYLGGTGDDYALGIAVDAAGEAYVVGWTDSADFPTVNPFQPALNQNRPYASDAFVTKFSADGSFFQFSTFLGGSANDAGRAIALDSSGNAYITGDTASTDFPVTPGTFQTTVKNGNAAYPDHGFVTKLSPDGSSLLYSTYLGGSTQDVPFGIDVDASGNAYVTGGTTSEDFPTTPNAFQSVYAATAASCSIMFFCGSGFVTALNPQGSALLYSTFLGGTSWDATQAIVVDAAGNAYVTGLSNSLNFPTTPGALQTGPAYGPEGFAAKFSPQGQLVYATYLAGFSPAGIAIDNQGAAYLAGQGTPGSNPSLNSVQFGPPSLLGSAAVVAKLHPAGCALQYFAVLGGSWSGFGTAIAVDPSGAAFVAGGTSSYDFPTVNPVQASCPACLGANSTASPFLSKLDPTGLSLVYSTFLGGSNNPQLLCCNKANGVAIDSSGNAYIAGQTRSSDFPTANAIQPLYGGQEDAFVAKISPAIVPSLSITPTNLNFSTQVVGTTSPPQTVTLTNQESTSIGISSITSSDATDFLFTNTCGTGLGPGASCAINVSFAPTESGTLAAVLMIDDNAFAGPHVVGLTGTAITGPALSVSIAGNSFNFGGSPIGSTYGPLSWTVMNLGQSPLTISSIVATGDFSQTNNCVSTIAPQGSCTLNVAFNPTSGGTRTGTLTFTDNAPNSPQIIVLSGTGTDFSLTTTQASATVSAGQSATYTVTLSPDWGFTGQVTLGCTGAPQYAACLVSPAAPITLDGVNSATVTITVNTTAPSFLPPMGRSSPPRGAPLLPLTLLGVLILLAFLAASNRRRKLVAPLAATLLLGALWASCGGGAGGGGGGGGGGGNPGTPVGAYTLTLTGTSGSLSHTLSLTLTVK